MKHLSLASRYRPQKFSEVVGQQLVAAALSRAAAEDKAAPAYLLSGTRGVGKTTIARIFAKALNCEHAPGPEPCNECRQCKQITGGNHVDVSEIDGASNTGVDDVRALRENIGYMPMEGRYKIFIVDEAHMLSKNAFNALLKTLEEPPAHTVFIFATTEAHRFPATIISRCQHFVFKHLPEDVIFSHLCDILRREQVEYEQEAVRLLARRAAGSVRDSMSLLDQSLALGDHRLLAQTVRQSLGLAGQEFFAELFVALRERNCVKIVDICGQLLRSGVDIGFFIKELSGNLRNLFLLRQIGENILPVLGLPADETAFLKKYAELFSAAHLHASWQLTLESQRSIIQNPEPGAALEFLLLNLAMLPQLLPVNEVSALENNSASKSSEKNIRDETSMDKRSDPPQIATNARDADTPVSADCDSLKRSHADRVASYATRYAKNSNVENWTVREPENKAFSGLTDNGEKGTPAQAEHSRNIEFSWDDFCAFCQNENESGGSVLPKDILGQLKVNYKEGLLEIKAPNMLLWERFNKKRALFESSLGRYLGNTLPKIKYFQADSFKSHQDLITECAQREELMLCKRILGATIVDCNEKY